MLRDPWFLYFRRPFWRRQGSALSFRVDFKNAFKKMKWRRDRKGKKLSEFYLKIYAHPGLRGCRVNKPLEPTRCTALPVHRVLGRRQDDLRYSKEENNE